MNYDELIDTVEKQTDLLLNLVKRIENQDKILTALTIMNDVLKGEIMTLKEKIK